MPQKTNLNINPYFDDFDKDDILQSIIQTRFPIQLGVNDFTVYTPESG